MISKFFKSLTSPVIWSFANVSPYHHAIPVNDLDKCRWFYGEILQCEEGRSSQNWIDYNFFGHQLVCHFVSKTFDARELDRYNSVDNDEVPVPHYGIAFESLEQFQNIAKRVKDAGVKFIIEPHIRFIGKPGKSLKFPLNQFKGEQWTMFFKDPSGNNIECKYMSIQGNLFAKYDVK